MNANFPTRRITHLPYTSVRGAATIVPMPNVMKYVVQASKATSSLTLYSCIACGTVGAAFEDAKLTRHPVVAMIAVYIHLELTDQDLGLRRSSYLASDR